MKGIVTFQCPPTILCAKNCERVSLCLSHTLTPKMIRFASLSRNILPKTHSILTSKHTLKSSLAIRAFSSPGNDTTSPSHMYTCSMMHCDYIYHSRILAFFLPHVLQCVYKRHSRTKQRTMLFVGHVCLSICVHVQNVIANKHINYAEMFHV